MSELDNKIDQVRDILRTDDGISGEGARKKRSIDPNHGKKNPPSLGLR